MHYALICPDMTGHLNPMTTLGGALQRRGHRVSLVATPQSRRIAEIRQLEFLPIGEREHRDGTFAAARQDLARLQGISALRFTGRMLCDSASIVQRDAPDALTHADVDAVIWDQVSPAGESVAELLGLPHAMVCNALAIHSEPAVPPAVVGWRNQSGLLARCRNRLGNSLIRMAGHPLAKEINSFRRHHGIRRMWHPTVQNGGLIQVAQQPEFFDFARRQLPRQFHYTGPWHANDRDTGQAFPWDQLDGRPLVYASLGTLQNGLQGIFTSIAAACSNLDVQLVLSLGGSNVQLNDPLPPGSIIVNYAPQLELLKRAQAVITHAGLNTALETLSQAVPMVAIPITNDQPGVARRLESLGVAEYLRRGNATPDRIQRALKRVICEPKYQTAALSCRQLIQRSPGVDVAAEILDNKLSACGTFRRSVHRTILPPVTYSCRRR